MKTKSKQKEVKQFMNCKRLCMEAPLNVCNFKTKLPDEWNTPYDIALRNTAFMKKMMRVLPCVRAFQNSSNGN